MVVIPIFLSSCISFESYIKPQHQDMKIPIFLVVFLLNPTSNHNFKETDLEFVELYFFWILHQTTTCCWYGFRCRCCISFESYIKPQQMRLPIRERSSCISFESYIKPQPLKVIYFSFCVVFLLNPTSNHNREGVPFAWASLYFFWILHQTTTRSPSDWNHRSCISFESYIKPQPEAVS